MVRGIIILLLIIVASFLIFDMCNRNVVAQEADDVGKAASLSQVLENQELILEKLEVLDKKLDIIKVRIRL